MKPLKKPRSYSDFTTEHLRQMFGIVSIEEPLRLLKDVVSPSEWLQTTLTKNRAFSVKSEKAKSELLIMPVLVELSGHTPRQFQCFSGLTLDIAPEQSLKGRCDFLLTKSIQFDIAAPIIAVFEAKDDSLDHWYGQCGAEMLAARIFNEQRNEPITIIHGAVTNGFTWQFLRLEGSRLLIDTEIYALSDLPKLLGVLQSLIDFYYQEE